MSVISVLNRDSSNEYLNQKDSPELLEIESCVNWSEIAELCIDFAEKNDLETETLKQREICLSFCKEEEIQNLNRDFRNKDKVTDVLSFNFQDISGLDEVQPLGDIIICPKRAQEQAWELGYSLRRELIFLFAHGVFHLLGYDHETEDEAEKMFALQKQVIKTYGILD